MKLTREQRITVIVLVAGILFLFISFPLDNLILEFVDKTANPLLDYFFNWVSYALSLVFVLLIMTTLFLWEDNRKDWIIPLWFSFGLTLVLSYVIKFIVARERPEGAMQIFGLPDFSFPSSHAAISFSVVPILDLEYPMFKWFWILFAAFVAISRLYLKVHFLSDIIAGALIGYFVGKTIIYIKKKYSIFH